MRLIPVILAAAAIALTGCASTKVAVFDGEEGDDGQRAATGAVAVLDEETGQDVRLLDQANSLTSARKRKASARRTDGGKLNGRYGALLATLPPRPQLYSLIMKRDSTDPEDQSAVGALLDLVRSRPGADILIVGHTDTQGTNEYNDTLSVQRAQGVRAMLIANGFPADIIQASGRGERELMVKTGDEVAEPLNRRVDIIVR